MDLSNAIMQEPFSFEESSILGAANFNWSQFNQSTDFSGSQFNQFAYFWGSQFNQSANFWGSQFNQIAYFSGSQFNQIAYFSGSQFNQSANFWGSQFNQSANFWGSQFNQFAYFWGSQFNQIAYFSGSQFNQVAYFSESQFNQIAYFSESQFNQLADFRRSRFEKEAYFRQSFLEAADFNQTVFSGNLYFEGVRINNLNLTRAELGKIFVRWKSIGHLTYDETAYLLLMGNFKSFNFLEDANECYYAYRNDRRGTLPWHYQLLDYPLMLFYGYGVKPERPMLWALFFMLAFGGLFWKFRGILPKRDGEPGVDENAFSLPEALAFSAMTFLSGGKLVFDPPEYRVTPGRPRRDVQISKALFIIERLLGMVLVIMFAIAVGRTIILGGG